MENVQQELVQSTIILVVLRAFSFKIQPQKCKLNLILSNILVGQQAAGQGRVQAVLCCALSVPPRAVSSIQVAPSDISGVF